MGVEGSREGEEEEKRMSGPVAGSLDLSSTITKNKVGGEERLIFQDRFSFVLPRKRNFS